MYPFPKRLHPSLLFLIFAVLPSLASAQEAATQPVSPSTWETVSEHWYILEMAGTQAGWMHALTESDGARYRTTSASNLKIARGPIEITIAMHSMALEDLDGTPREISTVQDMSQQRMETRWVFHKGGVTETSKQGGREKVRERPLPEGKWLMPQAADRYFKERMKAGGDDAENLVIEYRTLTPDTGLKPVKMHHERTGVDSLPWQGRDIPLSVWAVTNDYLAGVVSTQKLSAEGVMVHDSVSLPFGTIITKLSTEAEARGALAGPAPELMLDTFVRVDQPLIHPHQQESMTLRVRTKDGTPPALPSSGGQRVKPDPDNPAAVLLTIDIMNNSKATPEEIADPAFRGSDTLIDADDPFIATLVKKALKGTGLSPGDEALNTISGANHLREFVYDYIDEKSLDTAFASASETARTRTGDCSEHAVLLCALFRGSKIPARVASGLVYAESFAGEHNIFGWHMWTQALIDGHWVDFDATLPVRYSAAHILTGTSALDESAALDWSASILTLLGNLEVEVVKTPE